MMHPHGRTGHRTISCFCSVIPLSGLLCSSKSTRTIYSRSSTALESHDKKL
jgi:cytochrome b561